MIAGGAPRPSAARRRDGGVTAAPRNKRIFSSVRQALLALPSLLISACTISQPPPAITTTGPGPKLHIKVSVTNYLPGDGFSLDAASADAAVVLLITNRSELPVTVRQVSIASVANAAPFKLVPFKRGAAETISPGRTATIKLWVGSRTSGLVYNQLKYDPAIVEGIVEATTDHAEFQQTFRQRVD